MKKEYIILFTIYCFLSLKAYANNINEFLNSKLPNNFNSLKKKCRVGLYF